MSDQLSTLTEKSQGLADQVASLETMLADKQAEGEEVELDSDLVDPNVLLRLSMALKKN